MRLIHRTKSQCILTYTMAHSFIAASIPSTLILTPQEAHRDGLICRVYEHQVFWLEQLAAIVSIAWLSVD